MTKTRISILFLCGIILVTAFSCEKEDKPELSGIVEGYVVASFQVTETLDGHLTNNIPRSYCILLDTGNIDNREWGMDFYTFNFPDNLIDFPPEIFVNHYGYHCYGPSFFPDSLKRAYKIRFTYRGILESEKIDFIPDTPCPAWIIPFKWKQFKQMIIEDATKINN